MQYKRECTFNLDSILICLSGLGIVFLLENYKKALLVFFAEQSHLRGRSFRSTT